METNELPKFATPGLRRIYELQFILRYLDKSTVNAAELEKVLQNQIDQFASRRSE